MIVKVDAVEFQIAPRWKKTVIALLDDLSKATAEEYSGVPTGAPRLIHCGQRKIAVIKAIRQATGLNLRDAKALADRAPVDLPNMSSAIASEFVREVREAGGTVEPPTLGAIDRLAKMGERIELETPEAEELYSRYLTAQSALTGVLRAGEGNSVFRAQIEAALPHDS